MKRILIIPLMILLSGPAAFAESRTQVSGVEWLQLSAGQRTNYIMASMLVLSKSGVPLSGSPGEYYDLVQQSLLRDPRLYPKSVTNILASIVYNNEPAARVSLDAVRNKAEVKKIEMH